MLDVHPAELPHLEENCLIYVDEPEAISGYLKSKDGVPIPGNKLVEMEEISALSLYELGKILGGFEAAGHWSELSPIYLRQDPASAKYPAGIKPKT